jgi:acetyl esterase/lipase
MALGVALASVVAGCDRPAPTAPKAAQTAAKAEPPAEEWFTHATLGFRVRLPGPGFRKMSPVEQSGTEGAETHAWQSEAKDAALAIVVGGTELTDNRLMLESSFAGMKVAMSEGGTEEAPSRVDFEEITAEPPYVARTWGYSSGTPNAFTIRIVGAPGAKSGRLVSVMAFGELLEELGPSIESLHVPPEVSPRTTLEELQRRYPQLRKQRVPPRKEPPPGPPPPPPAGIELVGYKGPAGKLAAYLHAPADRKRRYPALLWCHGGFGGVGEASWTFSEAVMGEVGPLFAQAGFVVLSPAWRGESGSDGEPEIYWGEVDDALASIDYLAGLPFVDPSRIYVAGHSSGGGLALLAGQRSPRIRAVFSFGGVLHVGHLGESHYSVTFPFEPGHVLAAWLRSPLAGIPDTKVPTFHFEGSKSAYGAEQVARRVARRAGVPFRAFVLDGLNHWTAVPPMARLAIAKATADRPGATIDITDAEVAAAASNASKAGAR